VIGLAQVYALVGATFAGFAILSAVRGRPGNAAFWGCMAASFLFGDRLGDAANGVLALLVAGLAGVRLLRPALPIVADRPPAPARRLFALALTVPLVTVLGTLAFGAVPALVEPKQATLVALAAGVLVALALVFLLLRPRPLEPLAAGLSLLDQVGWAAVLPQMLASLGAVFALAHVGDVIGGLAGHVIPAGSLLGAVAAYAGGMALLTMVLGNAFAAFPVLLSAIGLPLLVREHGGDPAAVAAIGMLAGFCGTLLTPMAANFNLVPAALLDLPDRYGVIRAQAPTALVLLVVNGALLWWLAFP
jgi:uncharacterized membrane protein